MNTFLDDIGVFGILAGLAGGIIFAIFAVLSFRSARVRFKERDYLAALLSTTFGIMWSIPLIFALYYGWFAVIVNYR